MNLDVISKINVYIVVIIIAILIAEIAAYLWHRYLAHKSFLSLNLPTETVRFSHQLHHTEDFTHDATEDFVWIIYGLIVLIVIFVLLHMMGFFNWVPPGIIIAIILANCFVFFLNWYIHMIIHTEDHWLHNTSFMQDLKTIHTVHHEKPRYNYSIVNFADTLFGTHGTGFPYRLVDLEKI